jgi:hypothetical protein
MKRITARTLLAYSTEQLWEILAGDFILVFDNGEELQTSSRPTLYSSYGWDFHRKYPKTPLLPHHHVSHVLGKGRLAAGTHLKLLGNIVRTVFETYTTDEPINLGILSKMAYRIMNVIRRFRKKEDETVNLDQLSEMAYRIMNVMYNDLSYKCEEYVTSLDITDMIQVLDHPEIVASKLDAAPTEESIKRIHTAIETALMKDPVLYENQVAKAVRSKLANMGQVLQSVGPRAFIQDTDGHIFPRPVMRSFVEGLRAFHDSLIESRQAGMALAYSKAPLEQTEYFSRRLQLICQTVRNLHMGDCGSTEYLYWTIRGEVIENGKMVRKSDLELLVGKYFVNADGGLSCIRRQDRHLIGHTLKLRSPLHCAHPDPYGICSTCFGELAYNIPEGSNIGQTCGTSMTQQSSQNVLSTKHYVGGSSVSPIHLDDFERQFLEAAQDKKSYLLSQKLKGKRVRLIIPQQFASNFTDILDVKDVNQLNITRISELPSIGIIVGEGESAEPVPLDVSVDKRLASMTYPLLAYIKQVGWSYTEKQNYSIDMSGWDWTRPILELPMKNYNMSEHAAVIAEILEASMKDAEKRDMADAVDPTMADLFDHVNSRLHVNLAVLEVVLYAAMVRSARNGDYGLPKVGTDRGLGVMDLTIENRSLAAKMAYEHQKDTILSPRNYITPNRMDHPFDALLMPAEVLEDQL